jgi:hypothetical protein
MSDSKHENESGLIIDPVLLANIQAACRRRAAELGAATSAESRLNSEQEAERFAAAVPDMPENVRRFFQAEEPIISRRQSESAQDRLEREARARFGGWPGS